MYVGMAAVVCTRCTYKKIMITLAVSTPFHWYCLECKLF